MISIFRLGEIITEAHNSRDCSSLLLVASKIKKTKKTLKNQKTPKNPSILKSKTRLIWENVSDSYCEGKCTQIHPKERTGNYAFKNKKPIKCVYLYRTYGKLKKSIFNS